MKTANNTSKLSTNYYINLEKDELNWDWNFRRKRISTKLIMINIFLIAATGIFVYLQ